MGNATARSRSRSRPRPRPGRRRLLGQALAGSAWKLAAACAGIFALAFFGALSISFFLRPTRRYLFPLLTDIDAHHPESAILRSGTFLATLLLCATAAAVCATVSGAPASTSGGEKAAGGAALATAASNLNGDGDNFSTDSDVSDEEFTELRDTDGFEVGESLLYVGGDTSATQPAKPATRQEANRVMRRLRQQVAVATRTNRRALLLVFALAVLLAIMLYQGGMTRLSVAADAAEADNAEELSSGPVAPVSDLHAAQSDLAAESGVTLSELGASTGAIVLLYTAAAIWTALLMFLVWFFLRLQSTACTELPASSVEDMALAVADADASVQTSSSLIPLPTLSISNITLSSMSSSISSLSASVSSSVVALNAMESDELRSLVLERSRALWWRTIAAVRPICLIAQVVSAIKIVGLLYALNFFRIAEIGLINTTLLAALAFAEYTAAFFVAFFLIILAMDMRRAAEDELWISRLKIGTCCTSLPRQSVPGRPNVLTV